MKVVLALNMAITKQPFRGLDEAAVLSTLQAIEPKGIEICFRSEINGKQL